MRDSHGASSSSYDRAINVVQWSLLCSHAQTLPTDRGVGTNETYGEHHGLLNTCLKIRHPVFVHR